MESAFLSQGIFRGYGRKEQTKIQEYIKNQLQQGQTAKDWKIFEKEL